MSGSLTDVAGLIVGLRADADAEEEGAAARRAGAAS
jgi:hypothetical protein